MFLSAKSFAVFDYEKTKGLICYIGKEKKPVAFIFSDKLYYFTYTLKLTSDTYSIEVSTYKPYSTNKDYIFYQKALGRGRANVDRKTLMLSFGNFDTTQGGSCEAHLSQVVQQKFNKIKEAYQQKYDNQLRGNKI